MQCGFCWHVKCYGISEEALELIENFKTHFGNSWKCKTCHSLTDGIFNVVQQNKVEISKVNTRVTKMEDDLETVKKELARVTKLAENNNKQSKSMGRETAQRVVQEMSDQNSRAKNLVVYGKPISCRTREQQDDLDREFIERLCDELDVPFNIKSNKRL